MRARRRGSRSHRHGEATVLEVGARGRLRGAAFVLVGRTLVKSTGGGWWNEWTVRLDDGREATLAEARGSFTWFVRGELAPSYEQSVVGEPLGAPELVVVERGEARRVARWGDVPDAPARYRYVDLSANTGEAATIDYGASTPTTYRGRPVTLKELGLAPRPDPPRFFRAAAGSPPRAFAPRFALGSSATLVRGAAFRVLAILGRHIRASGKRRAWVEYVLYEPTVGLRWLVDTGERDLLLVESVEPGLVTEVPGRGAIAGGVRYRYDGGGRARLAWATGELPWEISGDDVVDVRDYARGSQVLSRECSATELAWSRGAYVDARRVERAFAAEGARRPPETSPLPSARRAPRDHVSGR